MLASQMPRALAVQMSIQPQVAVTPRGTINAVAAPVRLHLGADGAGRQEAAYFDRLATSCAFSKLSITAP
jgi:hypothetical protein